MLSASHALAAPVHFAIPPGPLNQAVVTFSRQSGQQVALDSALAAKATASPVYGTMEPEDALTHLLQGTGLDVDAHQKNMLIVRKSTSAPAKTRTHNDSTKKEKSAEEHITVLGRAMRLSPAVVPLDITEPTSRIQSNFINNNIIPLASVDDIIKFQPSIWTQNPNGPGMGKAETMSLRGFQDGQYNMTYDGIPFGDASDLHHTTSSLFISHFLGEAQIDRGPGTASTIGNATFGGTVGFRSKTPPSKAGAQLYGTYGSFNTRAGGLELDSGKTRFGKIVLDMQHEETDGYLTNSYEKRSNILFKDEIKLADDTILTIQTTYNKEWQYTTQGATLEDYAKYGNNYGLCKDPTRQCYYGYNPSTYTSDFSYIALKTRLNNWLSLHNSLYTTGFEHEYTESTDSSQRSLDANGVTFYNAAGKKVATYKSDIPGKYADAHFRNYGDTLNLTAKTHYVDVQLGVWADVQKDRRISYAVDLSKGSIPVPGKTGSPYSYNISDTNTTLQPYLELDIHPLPGMTIKPGIKYSYFHRDYDAALNKSTKQPLNATQTFTSWQPSIAINQRIMSQWSAYAQIARGFLAPPISVFQVGNVGNVKPETTMNYQIGSVYRDKKWMLAADAYYINFSNYIAAAQISVPGYGTTSTYVNSGGAIYKGLELEAQYVIGYGLSLYGNYSVNSAKYKHTDVDVASTPNMLASFGLLYENERGAYFSIIGKYVGKHWGLDSTTNAAGNTQFANQYKINSNVTADLALGWRIRNAGSIFREITPSLKIGNLFNNQAISNFAGNQSYGDAPLYWRNPGRSVFFNLAVTMP
ncbi:TonB-dependent receptor domain-containing protein [Acetobacter papayae]|uniref:TonB-dependent receptor domain-containing protein n=1 Tax=Acetobacter papayae TaxID=1076592 RepID=UPI001F1C6EBD|nr:TonB-dependent receptor [Acetobacter papayae]